MHWLFSWRRLKQLGVIGLNARNAGAIMGNNPRALFPIVDDKIVMSEIGTRVGLPMPETRGIISTHGDLQFLGESLAANPDVVIKPARGAGGRGVMVLVGRTEAGYRESGGRLCSLSAVRQHVSDILSGLYSLGAKPDRAILQQRVTIHSALARISSGGTPDIRVLVFRGVPAMAMLRLPTMGSRGRANLHQGGVGVGLNLETGETTRAIWKGQLITRHPDTGEPLMGCSIPDWPAVLDLSMRTARATGLGYLGADIVLDEQRGPLLLEANARPGLAIQLANGIGLQHILNQIAQRKQ